PRRKLYPALNDPRSRGRFTAAAGVCRAPVSDSPALGNNSQAISRLGRQSPIISRSYLCGRPRGSARGKGRRRKRRPRVAQSQISGVNLASQHGRLLAGCRGTGALDMIPSDFICPGCGAGYKVVRVKPEADPPHRLIHCKVCKRSLAPTDKEYILKYFLISRKQAAKQRV